MRKVQVDFDSPKSKKHFIKYLTSSWNFKETDINKVIQKYSGQIEKYSPEHAALMYDLINEHFKNLSDEHKLGYISSKKTTFAYLEDSSAIEFFVTFFSSVVTSYIISSTNVNISFINKFEAIAIPFFLAIIVVFIKSSLKPKFYYEIITTMENNIKK